MITRYTEFDGSPPDLLDAEDRAKIEAALALLPPLWDSVTVAPAWEFVAAVRRGETVACHLRGVYVVFELNGRKAGGMLDVGWLATPAKALADVLLGAGLGPFGLSRPSSPPPAIDPTAVVIG